MLQTIASKYLAVLALLFLMITPATAFAAYNPLGQVDCRGQARSSAVCQTDAGDPINGRNGVIRRATRIIAIVAGAAAIIVMVLGGIRYITSGGDPSQVSQAKRTIIFALVGLIVIAASQSIINFIITRI